MRWNEIAIKDFLTTVSKSHNYAEVLRNLGFTCTGNNNRLLKKRLIDHRCDTSHFTASRSTVRYMLEDVLVENSPYLSTQHLKNRLVKERILENKCRICGLPDMWNNKPLTLQLDHINGVKSDNRIDNLRLVCPNCHTQTQTFCGKKTSKVYVKPIHTCPVCGGKKKTKKSPTCKKCVLLKRRKSERPSKEELTELVNNNGFCKVGRMFGVSDNAIRKWLKSED